MEIYQNNINVFMLILMVNDIHRYDSFPGFRQFPFFRKPVMSHRNDYPNQK